MALNPHDHRMWAVIGMYGGQEDNAFYRRSRQRTRDRGRPRPARRRRARDGRRHHPLRRQHPPRVRGRPARVRRRLLRARSFGVGLRTPTRSGRATSTAPAASSRRQTSAGSRSVTRSLRVRRRYSEANAHRTALLATTASSAPSRLHRTWSSPPHSPCGTHRRPTPCRRGARRGGQQSELGRCPDRNDLPAWPPRP